MTNIMLGIEAGELQWLVGIMNELKPTKILEVGTMEGGSLREFVLQVPTIRHAVSVDMFFPQWDRRNTWGEWKGDTEIVTVQGNCLEYETENRVRNYQPFDFVFIDADHQYHCMKHDWEVYGGMCRPGGIVSFHDIATIPHEGFGGWKLWPEIRKVNKTAERIDFPERYWGGIGVVFK